MNGLESTTIGTTNMGINSQVMLNNVHLSIEQMSETLESTLDPIVYADESCENKRFVEQDTEATKLFLLALDNPTEFRTFSDKDKTNNQLTKKPKGDFDALKDQLVYLNNQDAGIFVVINEGGQNDSEIIKIRAVFADFDCTPIPNKFNLNPSIIIQSSSTEKKHFYWLVKGDFPLAQFKPMQQAIASKYGSDTAICNLSRVMRLPGFVHNKGDPVRTEIISCDASIRYTYEQLSNEFKPETVSFKKTAHKALGGQIAKGGRNSFLTSEAGRMRRVGCSENQILAALLITNVDVCKPPLEDAEVERIVRSVSKYYPADATDVIHIDFPDSEPNDDEEPHDKLKQTTEFVPFPEPFPGVMADMVNAVLLVAVKPQQALTTLGVLAGMSSACNGNYFIESSSGLRLNLYCCGVAGTGEGKDQPLQIAYKLAYEVGAKVIAKPASGEGLEDELEDYSSILMEVDEIAHWFKAANSAQAAPYLVTLSGNVLKLFSASQGSYHTRSKAKTPAKRIKNPALNIIGFSTPEKLGEAINVGNIEDGLLGRMLFAFGDGGVRTRRARGELILPPTMKCAIAKLVAFRKTITVTADVKVTFLQNLGVNIVIQADADKYIDSLMGKFDDSALSTQSAFAKALYQRSFEKTMRVAGVLSVWDNPKQPEISLEHLQWAERLVLASNTNLVYFADNYMHGGKVQSDAASILKLIIRVLNGEIIPERPNECAMVAQEIAPRRTVMSKSKLSADDFDKATKHLIALGNVVEVDTEIKAGNGQLYKLKGLKLE